MSGRQAKLLTALDVQDLLVFASCTRNPIRNRVIVLPSAKAALRAGEIANLTWTMVLDGNGRISNVIELHDLAAKKGSGSDARPIATRVPRPSYDRSPSYLSSAPTRSITAAGVP
jgi:integrase